MKKSKGIKFDPAKVSQAVRDANPHLWAPNPAYETATHGIYCPVESLELKKPKLPKPRKMTRPEMEMEKLLDLQKRNGMIFDFGFEEITLRLGDDCRYTCDFTIWENDGRISMTEVKGPFIRPDSLVKFRVAKEKFPKIMFTLWQRAKDGGWTQLY